MPDDDRPTSYTLGELSDLADVTPRTIRYYVQQGLLRSPEGAGPMTRYEEGHLWRLRLTRQLQREHLPLADIRKRLAALSDEEVRGRVAGAPVAVRESAAEYIDGVLRTRGIPGHQARLVRPAAPLMADRDPATLEADRPTSEQSAARGTRWLIEPVVGPADPAAAMPPPLPAAAMPPPPGAAASTSSWSAAPEAAAGAPPDRSQWDRVALSPDVELHIRRPLSRDHNRRVDRVISIARQLLEEDTP